MLLLAILVIVAVFFRHHETVLFAHRLVLASSRHVMVMADFTGHQMLVVTCFEIKTRNQQFSKTIMNST